MSPFSSTLPPYSPSFKRGGSEQDGTEEKSRALVGTMTAVVRPRCHPQAAAAALPSPADAAVCAPLVFREPCACLLPVVLSPDACAGSAFSLGDTSR